LVDNKLNPTFKLLTGFVPKKTAHLSIKTDLHFQFYCAAAFSLTKLLNKFFFGKSGLGLN
jgi:hypothetical protein